MVERRTNGNTFSSLQHEAGDRAYVIAQQFNDVLKNHPFVAERPDLNDRCDQIADALGELYQAIWRAS